MKHTKQYLVKWVIDIEANSPEEAAKLALEIQRDENSEALAFTVKEQATGEETDVKCEVEFEKVAPSKNGEIFRVEANLWLHGKLYRAEATEISFEIAIDEVKSELDKELRRTNGKRDSLMKRGGRKIKEMLCFGS